MAEILYDREAINASVTFDVPRNSECRRNHKEYYYRVYHHFKYAYRLRKCLPPNKFVTARTVWMEMFGNDVFRLGWEISFLLEVSNTFKLGIVKKLMDAPLHLTLFVDGHQHINGRFSDEEMFKYVDGKDKLYFTW